MAKEPSTGNLSQRRPSPALTPGGAAGPCPSGGEHIVVNAIRFIPVYYRKRNYRDWRRIRFQMCWLCGAKL